MAKDHNYNQDLEDYKFFRMSRRGEFLYANPIHKRLEKLDKKQLKVFNYMMFKLYSQEIASLTHPVLALSLDPELNSPLHWQKYLNSYRGQDQIAIAQLLENSQEAAQVFLDNLSPQEAKLITRLQEDEEYALELGNKLQEGTGSAEELRIYELATESLSLAQEIAYYEEILASDPSAQLTINPQNLALQLYTYFFIRQVFASLGQEVLDAGANFKEEDQEQAPSLALKIITNHPLIAKDQKGQANTQHLVRDLLLPLSYFATTASYFPQQFATIFNEEELATLAQASTLYQEVSQGLELSPVSKTTLEKAQALFPKVVENFKLTGLSLEQFALLIDLYQHALVTNYLNSDYPAALSSEIIQHLHYSLLDLKLPAKSIYEQIYKELVAHNLLTSTQLPEDEELVELLSQVDNFLFLDLLSTYALKGELSLGLDADDTTKVEFNANSSITSSTITINSLNRVLELLEHYIFKLEPNLRTLYIKRSNSLSTIGAEVNGEDLAASLQLAAYLSSAQGLGTATVPYFTKHKEENEAAYAFFANLPSNAEIYNSSLDLYCREEVPPVLGLALLHKLCYDYTSLATYFNHYMNSNNQEELEKLAKILSLRAIYSIRNLLELGKGRSIPYQDLKKQPLINKELDIQWRIYRYSANYSENIKHKGKEFNDKILAEHLSEIIKEEDPNNSILALYHNLQHQLANANAEHSHALSLNTEALATDKGLIRAVRDANKKLLTQSFLLRGQI